MLWVQQVFLALKPLKLWVQTYYLLQFSEYFYAKIYSPREIVGSDEPGVRLERSFRLSIAIIRLECSTWRF